MFLLLHIVATICLLVLTWSVLDPVREVGPAVLAIILSAAVLAGIWL